MDRFRFLICFLVLCVGVVFGLLLANAKINSFSGWKDFLEILSYVATVGMAGFAIWTLDAWKAQFGFEKRFATLKELGDSFEDLRVIFTHLRYIKAYHIEKSEGVDDSQLSELLADLERTGIMWDAAITKYAKNWRSSLFFITDDEFKTFAVNPQKLRSKIRSDLEALIQEVDGRTGPWISVYVSFKMAGINNEVVEIFRETDVLLFKIIKKSLSK